MYYPIRPLRSVVKESAKSGLHSVSTRDQRRGCRAEARVNKIRPLRILCIHVKKIQGLAQFRTKALKMPQYKKSYAQNLKKLCTCA